MPESCLYEGWVVGRAPGHHQFRYRFFLTYLDLGELPTLFENRWCWGFERATLASFRRTDHLGDPAVGLDQWIRQLVHQRTGRRPEGPIRLLTHLRYYGHCFNPVSFYYVFEKSGRDVASIVAEVHNTPWGERHAYVLDVDRGERRGSSWRFRFPKEFHVSPFMEMDHEYDWFLGEPGSRLTTHMKNRRGGSVVFDATMALERREIGTGSLARALLRYPWMTGQVSAGIYWQALRLAWKRAPFFEHPSNPWTLWRRA